MNKILKQALCLIIFLFFCGLYFHNKEICDLFKSGLGMILICTGILLVIGVFFALNIFLKDKFICFFWAGAFFAFGAGLHTSGIAMALMILGLYILAITIYFSIFIYEETKNFLLILGGITCTIGVILMCISDKFPTTSKVLSSPTEKPYVEDKYDYPIVWDLYGHESEIDNPHPSIFTINFGRTTGTLEQATTTIIQIRNEWEKENAPKKLMNLSKHDISYVKKVFLTDQDRQDYVLMSWQRD